MYRIWNNLLCLIILSVSLIFSHPVMEEDNISSQSGYEIYERLKSGDPDTWDTAGPYVVDLVNTMIENGEAKTPVHALLRIFWPELSTEEQTETLSRVEPMVRSLYRGLWNVSNGQRNLATYGQTGVHSGLQKRNPENAISLKEALKSLRYQSNEVESR